MLLQSCLPTWDGSGYEGDPAANQRVLNGELLRGGGVALAPRHGGGGGGEEGVRGVAGGQGARHAAAQVLLQLRQGAQGLGGTHQLQLLLGGAQLQLRLLAPAVHHREAVRKVCSKEGPSPPGLNNWEWNQCWGSGKNERAEKLKLYFQNFRSEDSGLQDCSVK